MTRFLFQVKQIAVHLHIYWILLVNETKRNGFDVQNELRPIEFEEK